jgi:hypothetical protein
LTSLPKIEKSAESIEAAILIFFFKLNL